MAYREIRIHGRGGQGAVTSSQVLAIAAFYDGLQSQAFPMFGVERCGAPVASFVRIRLRKINARHEIHKPDFVIVLDSSLVGTVNVTSGLRKKGCIIINSDKKAKELGIKNHWKVFTVNITKVAIDTIGKPFVNIAALGAFSALTKEVSLKSLKKAIDERFKDNKKVAELNKRATERVYKTCLE